MPVSWFSWSVPRLLAATALLAVAIGPGAPEAAGQDIGVNLWIEGESSESHTFNGHGWYSGDGIRTDWLSPGPPGQGGSSGDWLAHYSSTGQTAEATYAFRVPQDGEYTLWFRGSVYRVNQWMAIDDGPRQDLALDVDVRERMNLVTPGIDIRFLGWVNLGSHVLTAGEHRVTFGLDVHPAWADPQVHGGIDVVAISNTGWQPAGYLPPGQPSGPPGPSDWFVLRAEDDPMSDASVTDLSHMVERPAGARGPIRRQGDGFVTGDGQSIRFWGIGAAMADTPELQAQQARYYAKHGVNLVRLHPVEAVVGLLETDPTTGERRLNSERLDRLDRWFATLKERGIYSAWSPFYPHVITEADGYPEGLYAELLDMGPGKSTSGFVNVFEELQAAEWAWLRELMEHRNPYTGLRYAEDPALAWVEVHNEDSIFWHWPLNLLAAGTDFPRHTARLKAMWAEWLRGRYASDAELFAAWGPVGAGRRPADSLANDNMDIYGAWQMEADGPAQAKAETARMGDYVRFLAETQRAYFAERGAALRGLGYEGVTITTAWMAGGPAGDAANLWTDTALDAIDRHGYFGGGAGGHGIEAGEVNNGSHLDRPGEGILTRAFQQAEGLPFVMSEWSQLPPNQWKAEIAPLMAFYGMGLQGWDGLIHFHGSLPRMGSGWPMLNSYVTETPHYIGQFPVLARAVHRGDLTPGAVAAARRITPDQAFAGVDPLTQPAPAPGWDGTETQATPPEVMAIGRVTTQIEPDASAPERLNWSDYWDAGSGVIRSTTDELVWDVEDRVVTVRAPRTQGVVGVAGGSTYALPDVRVEVDTPFVSLLMTSLDDQPLAASSHWLVTAMARDRQTGAAYNADGTQLLDVGGPPLLLEPVQARLRFNGREPISVRPLDIHGVSRGIDLPIDGDTVVIDGRYTTTAYEVRFEDGGAPTATATDVGTPETPGTPTPGTGTPDTATPGAGTATPGDRPSPTAGGPGGMKVYLPVSVKM